MNLNTSVGLINAEMRAALPDNVHGQHSKPVAASYSAAAGHCQLHGTRHNGVSTRLVNGTGTGQMDGCNV